MDNLFVFNDTSVGFIYILCELSVTAMWVFFQYVVHVSCGLCGLLTYSVGCLWLNLLVFFASSLFVSDYVMLVLF